MTSVDEKNNITITKGNTPSIVVTVTDDAGTVIDLTAYTMTIAVKKHKEDSDSDAIIGPTTATISAPATGVGSFSLSAAATTVPAGQYWYDIKINNSTTDVQTVIRKANFIVEQNIS